MNYPFLLKLSAELLNQINPLYPPDKIVASYFREKKFLGSHDRKFISETIFGAIRWKRLIEYYLNTISKNLNNPEIQQNWNLLKCYSYQISCLKDENCINYSFTEELAFLDLIKNELLKITKTEIVASNEIEKYGIKYSYPDWLISEWFNNYSKVEFENICNSNNLQAPITLRVNTIKVTREECQKELLLENVSTTITKYSPFGLNLEKRINVFSLNSFQKGYFEVQDEGSQLLTLLLNPKPGAKIIDACCGAGGKSLALAALMKNKGEIFGFDIYERKHEEFKKRIRRAGVDIVRLQIITENIIPDKYKNIADILLVDAPCSGIGTLRRNPGMKWSVTPKSIEEISIKQLAILQNYTETLKVGGKLIYATCSITKQENEDVVDKFLESRNNFILESAENSFAFYGIEGLAVEKYFKLHPHIHNTDGFFAAILKKIN